MIGIQIQDTGLTVVKGSFHYFRLYLFTKGGSILDGQKKSGLAHICEHICLVELDRRRTETGIATKGITDFDVIILQFHLTDDYATIINLVEYIKDIFCLSDNIFNEKNLNIAKSEVLYELKRFHNKYQRQKKIISFISGGYLTDLPVGNRKDILTITLDDVKSFISNYFRNIRIVIIADQAFNNQNIIENLYQWMDQAVGSNIAKKKAEYLVEKPNLLRIKEKGRNNTKLNFYFQCNCNKYHITERIFRSILEQLLEQFLDLYHHVMPNTTAASHKRMDKEHDYICLSLLIEPILSIEAFIDELIHCLLMHTFTQEELKIAKDKISKELYFPGEEDIDEVIDELCQYYIYDDSPILSTDDFSALSKELDHIGAAEFNRYKIKTITDNYHVVLFEKDED